MSRTVSSSMRGAIYSQETSEAFIVLLTIDHLSLDIPIRVSGDAVNTISRGETFVAFPFEITLPDDVDNSSPKARLVIDNVDRQIVKTLREISSAADVLIEIIRASEPDTVEARFTNFKLTNVSYDALKVEGDLTIEDFTSEPFPAAIFSPSLFPGIF